MQKKNKITIRLGSKRAAECHDAAIRLIGMLDSDITPETIYWRALFERCKRFEAEREEPCDRLKSNAGIGRIQECKTGQLPHKVGRLLGRG